MRNIIVYDFFPEHKCANPKCNKMIPEPMRWCSSKCEDEMKGLDTKKWRHERTKALKWGDEHIKEECRCGYVYDGKEFDNRFCPNCGAQKKGSLI